MKNNFKFIVFLIFIFSNSFSSDCNQKICQNVKTIFIPISASQNLYTQYHKPINLIEDNCLGSSLSITYRYQQSFNSDEVAKSIFQYNPLLFEGLQDGATLDDADFGRSPNALIPEYFGLSQTTNTSLYLSPRIKNNIIDLQLAIGGENFWIQANIPIMQSQWQINSARMPLNNYEVGNDPLQIGTETDISNNVPNTDYTNYTGSLYIAIPTAGTPPAENLRYYTLNENDYSDFAEGLFENEIDIIGDFSATTPVVGLGSWGDMAFIQNILIPPALLDGSIGIEEQNIPIEPYYNPLITDPGESKNSGGSLTPNSLNSVTIGQSFVKNAESLTEALSGYTFGQLSERKYNKFNFNMDTKTESWALADIIVKLGFDFVKNEKCNAGFYLRTVIPTGTNINENWSEFVFSPVIGNGRHYELGVGFSGNYNLCLNDTKKVSLTIEGYIDHMFANTQFRSFDLSGLPMSRYAIVKELTYSSQASPVNFEDLYQYNGVLRALGDVNANSIDVGIDIHGEFIADLTLQCNSLALGLGYAFAGQSQEKIYGCQKNELQNNTDLEINDNTYYGFKSFAPLIDMYCTTYGNVDQKPTDTCSIGGCIIDIETSNPLKTPYFYTTPQTINCDPKTDPKNNFDTTGPFCGDFFNVKSSGEVTKNGNSGAYLYGSLSLLEPTFDENGELIEDLFGPQPDDVFSLPDILNNDSGLMNAQILNKVFGHIDYTWDSLYKPTLGVIGAVGFSLDSYFTMASWEFGLRFGLNY